MVYHPVPAERTLLLTTITLKRKRKLVTNKPVMVRAVVKPVRFLDLDLEKSRLTRTRSLTMSHR
jgi:hypothetical protein